MTKLSLEEAVKFARRIDNWKKTHDQKYHGNLVGICVEIEEDGYKINDIINYILTISTKKKKILEYIATNSQFHEKRSDYSSLSCLFNYAKKMYEDKKMEESEDIQKIKRIARDKTK